MGARDYWSQAKFWSREYPRRARAGLVNAVPAGVNGRIVRALESSARPRDLNLQTTFPRVVEILAETIVLSDPVLLEVPAIPGLLDADTFWYPPVRVRRLVDVSFDVNSGLVFSRGWVVNGTGTGHRWSMDSAFITGAAVRVRAGRGRSVPSPVAGLGNVVEHYHFMLEALPQIRRIAQAAPEVTFYTCEEPFPLAQQILNELGIRYRLVPRDVVLDSVDVWFCEGFPRDRTHPADMQLIHDALVSSAAPEATPFGSHIYISRAKSGRPLKEEHLLEDFLRERGFDVVYLEEMSLADQVSCLNGAELVVSPHGAGLGNTVFMKPGGRVIEIATGECWTNAYRRLAVARGHKYELVMLRSVDDSEFGLGLATDAIAALRPMLDEPAEC